MRTGFTTGLIAAATLALSVLAVTSPALAQSGADTARVDRLEKQLRELRSIVFQGRDTGQPVVVKPEGPDPAVTALQQRLDDLDQTLRRISGQIDVNSHDSDEARRTAQQNHDTLIELRAQVQSLSDRIAKLEAGGAAAPAAPQAAAEPPPPLRSGRTGDADATARANERAATAPREVLGAGAPASPGGNEGAAYRNAIALQDQGDYAGASLAWQDYISHWGAGVKGKEARYRLGESLYIQSDYGQAARAYAEALKGWPKTLWAPDATVKLSASLAQLGRRDEACQLVGEFQSRYGATAPAPVKARARGIRTKAACPAA